MSLRTLPFLGLLAALTAAAPAPALAHFHGGHGGRFHHFHHSCCFSPSRFFLGLNFAFPAWYPPAPYYYPPPPVVYAPPAVAYPAQPSVALGRDVGQGCREYTAPVTVGGQVVQSYGIACPRSDGSWQIVN
jgi:hypothetical protein